jgi:FemAB-related protein (PEP-CTERM system-associated)
MAQTAGAVRLDLKHLPSVAAPQVDTFHLQPGEEHEWDRFVVSSRSGTFFHLSGWNTLVERALGHKCFWLTARREDGISGVFPITWVRNKLFGSCLVSSPLAVYGGICADDQDSYFSLLKAGRDLANRLGVQYLEMRNRTEPFPTYLPGRDLYVTFTQDLSPGAERLFQGLPRDTRYAIRKSLKAGLAWTDDLNLQDFYDIYARSVHRLGTPVFSRNLFADLLSQFPKHCKLFGVRKGEKAIAGVICFYFRDEVLPYYAGSLQEYYKDAPNNFMYWNLISQSCSEGYRSFDFGRSKRGTGTYNFKSTWSMTVTGLPYRYQLIQAKSIPEMSPVDTKFRLPVALWKRLPFAWTKVLGPRLIRCIPSV